MIEIPPARDDEAKLLRGLALRCGIGRMPPEHAVKTARELDYTEMFVDSDPGAEPFYLRLGAPPLDRGDEPRASSPALPAERQEHMRIERARAHRGRDQNFPTSCPNTRRPRHLWRRSRVGVDGTGLHMSCFPGPRSGWMPRPVPPEWYR